MPTKPTLPHDLPAKVLREIKPYTNKGRRITKAQIAKRLGLSYSKSSTDPVDRAIRLAVAELRNQDEPICAVPGVAGYWYSYDDLLELAAQLRARANNEHQTANAMERIYKRHQWRKHQPLERGRNETVRQLELV